MIPLPISGPPCALTATADHRDQRLVARPPLAGRARRPASVASGGGRDDHGFPSLDTPPADSARIAALPVVTGGRLPRNSGHSGGHSVV